MVQSTEQFDFDNDEVSHNVIARQSKMMCRATEKPMCSVHRVLVWYSPPGGGSYSCACQSTDGYKCKGRGKGRGRLPVWGVIASKIILLVPVHTAPVLG